MVSTARMKRIGPWHWQITFHSAFEDGMDTGYKLIGPEWLVRRRVWRDVYKRRGPWSVKVVV
jgi:hypothetical protein